MPSWSSDRAPAGRDRRVRPGLPLYITEAGYTTAATSFRDVQVTEEQQAEYLTQIYSLPQIQTDRVKAVVWFNLQELVRPGPSSSIRRSCPRRRVEEA